MVDYIRASRLVALLLMALLVWADLAVTGVDADQTPGPPLETGRATGLTSRGGARPLAGLAQGSEMLVPAPQVPFPTPIPTATPIVPTPTPVPPTPTPGPLLSPLGLFKTTAYSDSPLNGTDGRGITRSGERTRWGVVAVDPRVIPLRSRVVIEGMGDTVFDALDTGGGITGSWLDLWFPTDYEAIQYGVKWRNIYLVVD